MKRIVKLIAVDNRYKVTSYPFRPVFDERLKTFRTGQHIDPDKPETRNNLTVEEMRNPASISAEKKKKFPFVINPDAVYNITNPMNFDLSVENGSPVNVMDTAIFNMLKQEFWRLAPEKNKVIPKTHYYYVYDNIHEAEVRVKSSDLEYKAQKFVREELDNDGLKDLALILAYKVKTFDYEPNTISDLLLMDKIIALCKTEPEKVLECRSSKSNTEIYILKLALHNIISRKGFDFFYGSDFLGNTIEDVDKWMKDESRNAIVSKWNKQLVEIEGRMPSFQRGKSEELDEKADLISKLKVKTLIQLKAFAGQKKYPKEEWEGIDNEEGMIKYILSKQ